MSPRQLNPEEDVYATRDRARAARIDAEAALAALQGRRGLSEIAQSTAESDVITASRRLATEGEQASEAFHAATKRVAEARAVYQALNNEAVPDAEARLKNANAAEVQALRLVTYFEAQQLRDRQVEKFVEAYNKLAQDFVELLMQTSMAEFSVQSANLDLPTGFDRLLGVEETARANNPSRREIITDEVVERWTHFDGRLVSENLLRHVRDHGDGGGLLSDEAFGTNSLKSSVRVRLARWRHKVWRVPAAPGYPAALAAMSFPGLRANDLPIWTASPGMSAATVVGILSKRSFDRPMPMQESWELERDG